MHATVKYLSSACAGALLIACADLGQRGEPPAPPPRLAGSPDDAYLVGRQQHLANRYPAAVASYQAALRLDPRHVNATNGLAALYAERGQVPQAIGLWRDLTLSSALPSGPGAAFLYSNLGYAYLLNGDYLQAIAALERACVLDPLNHRAWHHLGSSLEKLGQGERAQLMFKQAVALQQHDFKADYALAQRRGVAPIDGAVGAAAAGDGWAVTEVRQTASGMFELRRGVPPGAAAVASLPSVAPAGAAPPVAPAGAAPIDEEEVEEEGDEPPAAAATGPAGPEVARLEIRNGNGVTGMARALARKMTDTNLRVVRLTNQKPYTVAQTRVEYQGAFREAAVRLAARFGNASVQEVESCNNADLRLVIGRDLVRSKAEARRIIKGALARAAKAA
ncbi:MAG: tetratricopeptide repeat protein [Pseudomonadota bacterium]|nr:tetratricopeptide repeat protein [Pseudomonadota bacterium]